MSVPAYAVQAVADAYYAAYDRWNHSMRLFGARELDALTRCLSELGYETCGGRIRRAPLS